jgi:hypothetical protein
MTDPLEHVRVTTEDARQLGMCAPGVVAWFKTHGNAGAGFTLRQFATKGIPARQFLTESGNDAMAVRIVQHVCKRDGIEAEVP